MTRSIPTARGIRYRHKFGPLPLNHHPRTALIVRATLARLPGESVADACIRVAGQDLWQTKREAKRTQERAEVQEKLRRLAQSIAERRVLEPNPSPRLLERWGEQDKRNAKRLGVSVEELQTAIKRAKLPDSLTPHQRRIADRKARIEARAAEARAMGFRDHRARVRYERLHDPVRRTRHVEASHGLGADVVPPTIGQFHGWTGLQAHRR